MKTVGDGTSLDLGDETFAAFERLKTCVRQAAAGAEAMAELRGAPYSDVPWEAQLADDGDADLAELKQRRGT